MIANHKDITTNLRGLIIHGCNCQGVMGAGVAKAIKNKWPIVFEEFSKLPTGPELLGTFQPVQINENLFVGNCFTQEYYGSDGKQYASLDAIRKSVGEACQFAKDNDLSLISPLIGCGLGGLPLSDLMNLYRELEDKFEIQIELNYLINK